MRRTVVGWVVAIGGLWVVGDWIGALEAYFAFALVWDLVLYLADRVDRRRARPVASLRLTAQRLLVKHIEDNPDQAEDLLPLLDSYFEGGASALHAAYLRGAVA